MISILAADWAENRKAPLLGLGSLQTESADRQITTDLERVNTMNSRTAHNLSSMNRILLPVDESCTLLSAATQERGKWGEERECIAQMAFFLPHLCHRLSSTFSVSVLSFSGQ